MTTDPIAEKHPEAAPRRRWHWGGLVALLFCCVLLIAGYLYYFGGDAKKAAPRTAPPTSVLALPAKKSDLRVYLDGLGTVTALNTVTVRSRVDGQLMDVHFQEGQQVRRGELLAQIDPRPFQVQLTQAEGQLAKDRELLRNARVDLARYQELWAKDSIQKQQLDTQESLVKQLEAALHIDQGQVANAKLNLTYSRITAPIGGRVGLRQVDAGNIIHASDANGLVLITQMQPATVLFPIPEDSLPKVLARTKGSGKLAVEAYDRERKMKLAQGTLSTVDNQIDPATGTVRLKALFPNANNELFPNQFVNARLLLETKHDVVVVPAAAVQRGPQGTFLYVVRGDRTVAVRPVTLGTAEGDVVEVASGLDPGELVVVEGAERLREGSRVALRQGQPSGRGGRGPGAGQGGPPTAGRSGHGPGQLPAGGEPAARVPQTQPVQQVPGTR